MEQLGIRKVRLTGGEPMVRKNLPWLVEQIHGLPGIREIAMTTNGTLFAPQAEVYRKAGLTGSEHQPGHVGPERFRCSQAVTVQIVQQVWTVCSAQSMRRWSSSLG